MLQKLENTKEIEKKQREEKMLKMMNFATNNPVIEPPH